VLQVAAGGARIAGMGDLASERTYGRLTRAVAVLVALSGFWYGARGFKRTINRGRWPRAEAVPAIVCWALAAVMWRGQRKDR
jgi:hypothetical protein